MTIYVMKNKNLKRTPQGQFKSNKEIGIYINLNNVKHQKYINEKAQAYANLGMKYDY
jgi:hypothetical protein